MNNETPEWVLRLQQEHARKVKAWLRQYPMLRQMYGEVSGMMKAGAVFTMTDTDALTDPSWDAQDAHDIRHRFGIKDDIVWLQATIHLEAKGWTSWCSPSGTPIEGDIETYPLYEQLDFHIRMEGVSWMIHAFDIPDTEELFWCSECETECLHCHAPLRLPRQDFCGDCHPRNAND
jgi:hypothetical protein